MVRRASAPADSATVEVDQVREAVAGPLAFVIGAGQDAGWVALVDRAAELGGWGRDRWAALRVAVEPDRLDDLGSTLQALWGLVTELNECRALAGTSRG
jgi:hypothetical protein